MILFVCSQAFIRSRTAEILAMKGGALDVRSAGTDSTALFPVNQENLIAASRIYCMEPLHKNKIIKKFEKEIPNIRQKLITLGIPDEYERFNTDLVERLVAKLEHFDEVLAKQILIGSDLLYEAHPELKKASRQSFSIGYRGSAW